MSKILKGLNEVNPHNYDSDWDYQNAVASSGRSRSSYRSQEDDTSDADIAYSKKMYQLSQKQKRDADHDRLATGTNEEQLDELSNEKLGQYKTAAATDAGKADSEGDYKRADKRFSGIVKATKKQFSNDTKTVKEDINVVYKKAKSLLTQLDENTQQRVINALKKSVVKEFEGDVQAVDAPTTNKPPRQTFSIVLQGKPPKDFEARFVWAALQNVFPNDYPVGTDNAEWKVVEVSKKGSAIIKSGINNRDIAETLVAKLVKNKVPAPCLKIISSELGEGDEKPTEPFKSTYPRVNNPQILGTQNRAKSIYHPPSKPNVKKLDKPLPENLGNELKSKSLEALQQVKQQLEQQRMADLEQWEKDFKQNTVSKFTAREPNIRQRATSTSMVAMPGEKHSELKTRLGQLDKAIEKQGILDNLVQKLDKKGLLTPNIEAGVDTSMLARDGARDNYVELNKKLDKALEYVKNRLLTNKAAYAKPKGVDEDDGAPTRMRMNDYYEQADAIQEKLRQAIKIGDRARIEELNKQRDELDAHVKKYGMMPEDIAEEQLDELKCWSGYHRVAGTKAGFPGSCAKNKTNEEDVAEGKVINTYLWHGSRQKIPMLEPRQSVDTGGAAGSNQNAIYATSDPKVAIAMGLTTAGSDTGMFPNDPQMVLFSGKIRKGEYVYLHKLPFNGPDGKPQFVQGGNSREFHSIPGVEGIKPIEIKEIPVNKYLNLIRKATPADLKLRKKYMKEQGVAEAQHSESCPHCGGEMVSEELMNEKKDACYYKVKSRYKVWPSAYASGALVKCRNKGASNWGNGGKKNEGSILEGINRADESLHDWFNKEKWVRMDTKGNIKGPCAREPGEGKPKCLPQSKAHSLGKKGRASAAQRKRREDPNPERSGKAINVDTKKSKG